jgi:hypothetical protein
MKLPNGERADLGTKIEDYILNTSHPDGRHKARMFAAVLGITQANAGILRRALQTAAATSEAAEPRASDEFGRRYRLRVPVTTLKGSAIVHSGWIVARGDDFPRLTTCYIIRRR